jgi:hydroxymethylpyrimidine pyrophosphatase-like HAD family hydrolase
MIAVDMDGTLLNDTGQVSERNLAARLHARQLQWHGHANDGLRRP